MPHPNPTLPPAGQPSPPDLYRLFLEATTETAVALLDPAGRVAGWNPGAERFTGYPAGEAVGRPLAHFYTAADATAGKPDRDLRTALNRRRFEEDGLWVRRDGKTVRLRAVVTALRDGPRHAGFAVVFRDIPGPHPADEELRRTACLLRAVVDGIPDAVFVKDRAGRYLLFNPAAARFVGRAVEEVIGLDDSALFDPAGARLVMDLDQRVMRTGEAVTEEEVLTAAEVTRTYLATKAPFRDHMGNVIGVIGISRDITDRKRAEAVVRESEAQFRTLAECIPQIVWTARPDGTLDYLNGRAMEYAGLGQADLVGWSWERVIHPDDLPRVRDRWGAAVRTGEPEELEFRIRRADGTYRWHIARQVAVRDATGAVTRWFGTCTDIEDQKRSEAAVRAERDQLAGGKPTAG